MKWMNFVLRILVAATFIFSGASKLYPIEPFELTLVDVGISEWSFAPIFARLLIGLEFFLGIAILLNTKVLRRYLMATLLLTGFFTFYLILLLAFRGNDVNCGCFGNMILLTPIESIIKNVILMGIIWATVKTASEYERKLTWVYILIAAVGIVLPFILNVVSIDHNHPDNTEYPFEFNSSIIPDSSLQRINQDFSAGEHLVAFVSSTCSHCKVTVQKLGIADRKYDLPPISLFVFGEDEHMDQFFLEANARYPYSLLNHQSMFKFTNGIFPTVYYIKDGEVKKRWTGGELSYSAMQVFDKTVGVELETAHN